MELCHLNSGRNVTGAPVDGVECSPNCRKRDLWRCRRHTATGEECDDGVNDGGYGECGPGCKLGLVVAIA